jgi:IclR family transcriptional regulator, acetate operon repressor
MAEIKTTRNSPRRILEIIEAICLNPESATATGLSNTLGIPAPTIYRWLDALCEERFIAAHASGYYIPGERFRNLTLNSLRYEPNVTVRRSILRGLSETLKETVSLAVPHGTKLIYFDRLESHWPFQVNLKVGDELPMHCCASGKMYLSTLPIDDAMGIYERISQKPSARNTIVDAAAFKAEVNEIREQGFALDDQEWFDDMVGAAVPIFNEGGSLAACLSTHSLVTRKPVQSLRDEIAVMKAAAEELRANLISTPGGMS